MELVLKGGQYFFIRFTATGVGACKVVPMKAAAGSKLAMSILSGPRSGYLEIIQSNVVLARYGPEGWSGSESPNDKAIFGDASPPKLNSMELALSDGQAFLVRFAGKGGCQVIPDPAHPKGPDLLFVLLRDTTDASLDLTLPGLRFAVHLAQGWYSPQRQAVVSRTLPLTGATLPTTLTPLSPPASKAAPIKRDIAIIWDSSNFFVGLKNKWRETKCEEEVRRRYAAFRYARIMKRIQHGGDNVCRFAATSRGDFLQSHYDEFRSSEYEVELYERKPGHPEDPQVDRSIIRRILDFVNGVDPAQAHFGTTFRGIILVTGDGGPIGGYAEGFVGAIRDALEQNIHVRLYSWKTGRSSNWTKLEAYIVGLAASRVGTNAKTGTLQLRYLDDNFETWTQ